MASGTSIDLPKPSTNGEAAQRVGIGGPRSGELPRIFFVGPPRTATTWLHSVLQDRMNLPRTKETVFYDRRYGLGFGWYLAHFDHRADHLPKAEIAPTYFFSNLARRRILASAGRVKIVVTLRDPADRLYSLYRLRYSNGDFGWSLEDACEHDEEFSTATESSLHLAAWQDCFGAANVLTLLYEDLIADPQAFVDTVCRFADLPLFERKTQQCARLNSSTPAAMPRNRAWTRMGVRVGNWIYAREWERALALIRKLKLRRLFLEGGRAFPGMDPEGEQRLRRMLLPDIERLESMLGRDLSMWKPRSDSDFQHGEIEVAQAQATARMKRCAS
jgi:hypothetical protein